MYDTTRKQGVMQQQRLKMQRKGGWTIMKMENDICNAYDSIFVDM